jgi:ketosteroid isomerase-like protein
MASDQNGTKQAIEQVTQEWADAELRGDTDFLSRNLTDDFVGVGPFGFMLTRDQWVNRYASGDLHYDAFTLDESRVRVYDDAAIVVGRQLQAGNHQGHPLPPGGRATLIWVRQGGRWLLAGWHLSPIATPSA